MPTNRSRSASPERRSASPDARKRSRSPPRKPRGSGGFRWKSRQAAPDDEQPRRDFNDSYRPKRYDRDGGRHRDGRAPESRNMPDRNPDRRSRHTAAAGRDGSGPRSGGDRPDERSMDGVERKAKGPDKQQGASKSKSQNRSTQNPAALTGSAPATFIVVTVNDRLGTKASIPCLPSDTVGDFKKLVAAQIGRQPHEIMLKRQSERPFKDAITLADYGINNGVQIDLELNTGD